MPIVDEVNQLHQEVARLRERIELNLKAAATQRRKAFEAGFAFGIAQIYSGHNTSSAFAAWESAIESASRQEALNAGREP